MAVIAGSNDIAVYNQTTSTFAASNGEFVTQLTVVQNGMIDTAKIRVQAFNTTTSLRLSFLNLSGVELGTGILLASATPGADSTYSVAITPFAAYTGDIIYAALQPSNGSPRPYQNSVTNKVSYQTASTYASPQRPLNTSTLTSSALRQFHMWAEGSAVAVPTITVTGDVVYGSHKAWSTENFSPAIDDATLDGIDCSAVSSSGFTPPALVDGQVTARPGSRTLTATNGTQSDSETVNVTPPAGFNYVQLIAQSTDPARATPAEAVAGDHFMYENKNGTVITSAGLPSSSHEGEIIAWLVKDDTKIAGQYAIIFGEGGEYIETRKISARKIYAEKIKAVKITASKI